MSWQRALYLAALAVFLGLIVGGWGLLLIALFPAP